MVNEIPFAMWGLFAVIDLALIFIAILGTDLKNNAHIICSVLATTITFILSHSILNGNVVQYINGVSTPIRSLPFFYLLEGIAVLLVIWTVFLIWTAISNSITKHSVFEGMED